MEEIDIQIAEILDKHNSKAIPDFEGYSPNNMHFLLTDPFGDNSPIKIQKLTEEEYKAIPILNQVKYIISLIKEKGEVKLTKKGFLPTKVVADIYAQGYITDVHIECGISKLYKETDSMSVYLTRIITEFTGAIKKRKGVLSLTKSGETILEDNDKLLNLIFVKFGILFNWAYFDGYENTNSGKFGFGFTLILLSKFGHQKERDSFYAKKYFKAFPFLIDEFKKPTYGTVEQYAANCYSIRTFERFLDYFGLIEIEKLTSIFDSESYISKTDLFDKLIKRDPPNARYS